MDFQNFGLKIGRGVKLVCDFAVSSGVKDLRGCFIARYFLGMSKPGLQIEMLSQKEFKFAFKKVPCSNNRPNFNTML